MSDPKRANLITVGAPKSAKKIVNKTVRLTINLVESNESKYPELNYKELVIAEERKKRAENGKTGGLDPFSDNDDDVERVAKKFEQKYGNNSTYGKKKKRSNQDDFADIGAGYDENDSFIDNTHGYDEMIPPDIDTFLGGFYINCGSLEFKTVPHHDQSGAIDEPRRNKRRISSSSSEEESSESSSDSESQDTKEPKRIANGAIDSHKTEHRKKKNKKADKQKAKKLHRADSSAANSGKQTSDDNIHPDGEGESVDSRTSHSHSDSLASKPAPSSENAVTSDSSRDTETKTDPQLPQPVLQVLDSLEASIAKYLIENPAAPANTLLANNDGHIQRLEQALRRCACAAGVRRAARARAARAVGVPRARLRRLAAPGPQTTLENVQPSTNTATTTTATITTATTTTATTTTTTTTNRNKRKLVEEDDLDISSLSDEQREVMIMETIKRLMDLIEEFKPSMFANYNMECERVREEKKKLTSDGTAVEKRLPKRRFPWCHRSRSLLARITKLAGSQHAGAVVLADRVLPLFPKGFVRMPTLMRQANINKDIKVPEIKRQRLGSASQIPSIIPQNVPPSIKTPPLFPEQIQFPSSLTVTATVKSPPEKVETQTNQKDVNLGQIISSFALSKDLIVEREKSDNKEEMYIPPNSIGSITITPVPSQGSQKDKKTDKVQSTSKTSVDKPTAIQKTSTLDNKQSNATQKTATDKPNLIRVKSPAALNESVKKEVKTKKPEKTHPNPKDKRIDLPLLIETNFPQTKKEPSPRNKDTSPRSKETLSQKQIESLRVKENNIPRPALVPVHHSPTFAKPDKRPEGKSKEIVTDVKKKKEIMIVSDLDPLSDQEPVAVDDSSSDVEVIENDKCGESEVPSKDNKVPKKVEEPDEDINRVMRNIRAMEHSQEPTKFNSNSFSGIVANTNAKHRLPSQHGNFARNGILSRNPKDKFAERTSLNKTDGCNGDTG